MGGTSWGRRLPKGETEFDATKNEGGQDTWIDVAKVSSRIENYYSLNSIATL